MKGRRVLLLGATGLVGGQLLRQLLADARIGTVVALVRRPMAPPPGITREQAAKLDARVVDFDRLEESADAFTGAEQLFCALGTTIREAGSQEGFRRVDHDYPVEAGRIGQQLGASHYLLVSSMGADPASRIFYTRTKGEVERDVIALGYRSVTIVRPSLLLGERGEFRLGEEIAKRFAWATPRKWKPVQARDVASALVQAAHEGRPRVRIIESAEIARR